MPNHNVAHLIQAMQRSQSPETRCTVLVWGSSTSANMGAGVGSLGWQLKEAFQYAAGSLFGLAGEACVRCISGATNANAFPFTTAAIATATPRANDWEELDGGNWDSHLVTGGASKAMITGEPTVTAGYYAGWVCDADVASTTIANRAHTLRLRVTAETDSGPPNLDRYEFIDTSAGIDSVKLFHSVLGDNDPWNILPNDGAGVGAANFGTALTIVGTASADFAEVTGGSTEGTGLLVVETEQFPSDEKLGVGFVEKAFSSTGNTMGMHLYMMSFEMQIPGVRVGALNWGGAQIADSRYDAGANDDSRALLFSEHGKYQGDVAGICYVGLAMGHNDDLTDFDEFCADFDEDCELIVASGPNVRPIIFTPWPGDPSRGDALIAALKLKRDYMLAKGIENDWITIDLWEALPATLEPFQGVHLGTNGAAGHRGAELLIEYFQTILHPRNLAAYPPFENKLEILQLFKDAAQRGTRITFDDVQRLNDTDMQFLPDPVETLDPFE